MGIKVDIKRKLGEFSLDIHFQTESKRIGILGASGCGKSMTLKSIAGIETPDFGMIQIDDKVLFDSANKVDLKPQKRNVGYLFQNYALFPTMTVAKNIAAGLKGSKEEKQKKVQEMIEKFELNTKQRINKMSKGMLSMVTIIVALASKADFTFLDEPVAGLDVVMREYFYHKLMEEYTETGRTFVISTHIIEEAADLMEEVIMIKDGSLLLKENTQDLLERSYHVSGLAEVVDQAAEGYEKHHEEKMGRSKSVTILLKEGQELPKDYDVTIQPISLEKLFVSLCGLDD